MIGPKRFLLAGAFIALAAVPAAADSAPTLLGAFKDWSAFQATTRDGKVCYAMARPKSSEPRKAARDAIYFLISDWPSRKSKAEPQIVPGYQYKPDSKVTAQVGSDKVEFFTRNDGGSGSAWVEDQADEARLIDAMKRGAQLIVTGLSQHGTLTRDTYSLGGISAALEKVDQACGM